MNGNCYYLGLAGEVQLDIEESGLFCYYKENPNNNILVEGNRNEKSMRLLTRKSTVDDYVNVNENEIQIA